jgi:CheY-like chemotaxis protein
MADKLAVSNDVGIQDIHKYYLDIINCMPNIVYWVDMDCKLKGCSRLFVELLGMKRVKDLDGTPYEQMSQFSSWSSERIEAFKLDDMKVLFSGQAEYDVVEAPVIPKKGDPIYYKASRVPLFDRDNHVIGLVVVLTDVSAYKKLTESLVTQAPKTETLIEARSQMTPRILMVEDNVIAQKVEGALLRSLNCEVDIAESGDTAVSLFKPGKYDIVFMDIGLEDTSGYIVSKKIRQLEEKTKHHVPIVALTSYQADVVKYDCKEYSMDGVLTKPLSAEQAKQIIQYYIYHEQVDIEGFKRAE